MDENNNFLDKNTLLAITLSILFFVGWQFYVAKKYPKTEEANQAVIANTESEPDASIKSEQTRDSKEQQTTQVAEQTLTPEVPVGKTFDFENQKYKAVLNSQGMGLKIVELKTYSDREDQNIVFKNSNQNYGNFSNFYQGKPIQFNVKQISEKQFSGVAQVGNQQIIKEMVFDPENYTVAISLKTLSGNPLATDLIETQISNDVLKVKSSMFTPAYEGTEFFSLDDGSEERQRIDIEEKYNSSFDKVTLTSIGSQYFAVAVQDNSELIPKARVVYFPEQQTAYSSLFHNASMSSGKTDIKMTGFVGPKKYDVLKSLDGDFVKMINYGMFSVLSKPMLKMLKWLYGIFQNWGLAIILLTVFIRLLLLPINLSSLRSMKKMQKIQPQMKALKEKYKDDPQRMNQETMALMKKEKANPLGGCLPMFLQLPVFFALYSVLGQSVELYKSPFIFWIQDLSYQDPFFVLPVAVGALYFIQMSISPQPTMDPAQAKVMKFIPILFCFFMITVPSGLTLYFFVNTVFGIGQQFIFQREKRKAAV